MTVTEVEVKAATLWASLSNIMKAAILVASFIAAVGPIGATIWAFTGGPIGKMYRAEQAWRSGLEMRFDLLESEAARREAEAITRDSAMREEFASLRAENATLRVEIMDLKRPSEVFMIAASAAQAQQMQCAEGENCRVTALMRRYADALNCEPVKDSLRVYVVNTQTLQRREVAVLNRDELPIRLTDTFQEVVFEFLTPTAFAVSETGQGQIASIVVALRYDKCMGPEDLKQVPQESTLIPFRINSRAGNFTITPPETQQ